ncbi:MAG: hypothetical protein P1P89_02480 [Desulfobacterales bacterium]|nr:hypothetical protein [Desulfobacterales bacterium]
MRTSLKGCLFMVLFSSFVFIYFSLPYLTPPVRIVPDGLIFGKGRIGFLLLIVLCMTGAFIVTTFMHCSCHIIRKIFFKKNRIGEVFVSMGLITPDDLAAALSTRKIRIGDILMQKVLMTEVRKDRAPVFWENNYMNMGELLVKMGFSIDDEIQWALNQKKIIRVEILKKKKLVI